MIIHTAYISFQFLNKFADCNDCKDTHELPWTIYIQIYIYILHVIIIFSQSTFSPDIILCGWLGSKYHLLIINISTQSTLLRVSTGVAWTSHYRNQQPVPRLGHLPPWKRRRGHSPSPGPASSAAWAEFQSCATSCPACATWLCSLCLRQCHRHNTLITQR